MKYLLALAFLVGCGWTPRQKTLAGLATTTIALDLKQTYFITGQCTEANPIIGECGQRLPPELYFGIALMTLLSIAHESPEWRDVILGGALGVEATTVYNNASDGIPLF